MAVQVLMVPVQGSGADGVRHETDAGDDHCLCGRYVVMMLSGDAFGRLDDNKYRHKQEEYAACPSTQRQYLVAVITLVAFLLKALDEDVCSPVESKHQYVRAHVHTVGGKSHGVGEYSYGQFRQHDNKREENHKCRPALVDIYLIRVHLYIQFRVKKPKKAGRRR